MKTTFVTIVLAVVCGNLLCAADVAPKKTPPPQEPVAPNSKWLVNDRKRPVPEIVAPSAVLGQPPADAVVLFDGTDTSKLANAKGGACQWRVEDGALVVANGNVRTVDKFGSAQLHLEYYIAPNTEGKDQKRGNGGVFMMNAFEIQIHDSYENPTYADGQVGAVYGQTPPLVNAAKAPGNWQTLDIIFNAPTADENGNVAEPARVTVLVNGVVVQNNTPILGPTQNRVSTNWNGFKVADNYILFQDHKNNPPLRLRNLWVRPIRESHPLKN